MTVSPSRPAFSIKTAWYGSSTAGCLPLRTGCKKAVYNRWQRCKAPCRRRRQVCAGGQRPYPHRGGKAGLCQAGISPGEPRPAGGSVVLLPGHRSDLRARLGGHAGADGGAATPPGAPPSHLWRGHFRGRGGGFSPLLAPFFHKEASAAGGRLFSFHIHSLKFDHSRRSLPFFALSLTEVLSAGDITALPCRNLR